MANVTVNYTAAELPHVLDKISGKNLLHNWDFRNPPGGTSGAEAVIPWHTSTPRQ